MSSKCYVCSDPCDNLVEVEENIFVPLCSTNCETQFFDALFDMFPPKPPEAA